MNLTPWFPGDVQPVRAGVYQVEAMSWELVLYAHWSRRGWGWPSITLNVAASHLYRKHKFASSRGEWRGLAAPGPKPIEQGA